MSIEKARLYEILNAVETSEAVERIRLRGGDTRFIGNRPGIRESD